jgi:hypothetical protein
MKTLKLALVATLVAFVMVNVVSADDIKPAPKFGKMVSLTFEQALHVPGLVAAMYAQIDKEDVLNSPVLNYVARVSLNGIVYRISGTREQWIRFFKVKKDLPFNTNDEPVIKSNQ